VHIGVYGGSFDPPHNGHLALCLIARELLQLKRLIISVSKNPFKHAWGAPDTARKHMAELLSAEINLTGQTSEVCGWEIEKRQPSYTVDLLRYLQALYPNDRLTLLLGEDSFREFPAWKDHDIVLSLCSIAVFGRAAPTDASLMTDNQQPCGNCRFIDFSMPVSSTGIREMVAMGGSIEGLVPPSIRHYIIEHGLYR
jgi:nicotinate-nucleotide adenylyltransferase